VPVDAGSIPAAHDGAARMVKRPRGKRDRFAVAAKRHGVVVRSRVVDGSGWRWRVAWRGVEVGAWNDIDGVAIVADIGPWDEWVGLAGRPPDPSAVEALDWAVAALEPWLADPANAARVEQRVRDA
jgi:hypothetical protein